MIAIGGIAADGTQILSLYETEKAYDDGADPSATLTLVLPDGERNSSPKADRIIDLVRRMINERHKEPK